MIKVFNMKNGSSIFYTAILFLLLVSYPIFSQQENIISPYIQLQYFKNTDESRFLKTTLTYSLNRMEIPIPGMEISFFSEAEGKELLGAFFTDDKGVASLELTKNIKLPVNEDGLWVFTTEFKGNDTIEAGNSELSIKDVKLEMSLQEVDSIKTISLKAVTPQNNSDIPVSDEVVMIYVPRMFSLLPIGEATLDEGGTASLEFPSDLPGDSEGNLTIISRFEEHPDFGNIEKKVEIKWGVPSVNQAPVAHRALWTKTAPMWMIITLSVLLAGVWGHYLFAIISLILIKRNSKKKAKL
jgi:hypothetical protein